MPKDVIIVGGGVIGCSIAWRLAQAGLKVTVFERGRVGCEASRAAAGMLTPQGGATGPGTFFDLCLRSRAMYRSFGDELMEASGIDVEYKDEGTLFIVLRGEDEEEKTKWAEWQMEAGLPIEDVSNDLHRIEPEVTKSATRAIFLPEEHQVENRRLMDALEVAMTLAGVELKQGADVESLTIDRGNVTGVESNGERFACGLVIIAAGAWSSPLLKPLGLNIKVIPALGQMIAVQSAQPPISRVVHASDVYIVPRRDGRILIGATVEYSGFQKVIKVGATKHLLNSAVELVPSLESAEIVETWSGLRPDTADHLPVMGPSGVENLWLATGHFRNGILLAPLTAELIRDSIINRRLSNELRPFGVERLASSRTLND
jgi:glycine oxidase